MSNIKILQTDRPKNPMPSRKLTPAQLDWLQKHPRYCHPKNFELIQEFFEWTINDGTLMEYLENFQRDKINSGGVHKFDCEPRDLKTQTVFRQNLYHK